MVRFITGRARQGKTRQTYQEIKTALDRHDGTALLLLVPEQYTLQTEQELVKFLGVSGIMEVDVSSFRRLAQRLAAEEGGRSRVLLDELGLNLVLRRVIEKNRDQLVFFNRAAGQAGFPGNLSGTIRQFRQQAVTAEELAQAAALLEAVPERKLLARKLNDIKLLFEGLEHELAGSHLDSDGFINYFIDQIGQSRFLEGYHIWIDGFEGFSVQNMRIIAALAARCQEMSISLTLDLQGSDRDRELFWLSQNCLQQLEAMLDRQGTRHCRCPLAAVTDSSRPGFMSHLETELFSYPGRTYSGDSEGLELFSAANPAVEVEYAAAQITGLVMSTGCRYRDIAVVCSDLALYSALISRTFSEYEIPIFLDYKRPASSHPLTVLINSALAAIDRGFAYEDMALYLKSGLAGLDDSEAEKLENYVLAHGIRGSRWFQEFAYGRESELEELECLRKRIIEPLNRLREDAAAGGGTCGSLCTALYAFIEALNVRDSLDKAALKLHQRGQMESMYLIYQGWNHLMRLLDQIHSLLGSQKASVKDFRALWASGLSSIELGLIPTTVDQVMISDINSSFSADVQAVFILGLNDGMLPAIHKSSSLLDDDEMEMLCQAGIEMDYDRQRPMARERLLIYSLFNKPSRFLFLSYSRADMNGRALRPSLLAERLGQLFPTLKRRDDLVSPEDFERSLLLRRRPLMRHLSAHMRIERGEGEDAFWEALKDSLEPVPGACSATTGLYFTDLANRGLQSGSQVCRLGEEQPGLLYGPAGYTSVSRLESQAACPFAYLAAYGLNLQPRQVFALENTDTGLLMHQAMTALSARLRTDEIEWGQLPEGAAAELAAAFMDETINSQYGELILFCGRHRIMADRLQRLARRTAETITWQVRQGHFRPWREELRFGPEDELPALPIMTPQHQLLHLRGSIDRVDLYMPPGDDAVSYIRIIDYKTSARRIDYAMLLAGLNLQLPLYMLALQNARPEFEAAGMFYLALNDSMAREARIRPPSSARMRSNLKMQGLFLSDSDLIRAMDQDIVAYSQVLNARLTGDGNPARGQGGLQPEEFARLLSFVRDRAAQLGDQCRESMVRVSPYRYGSRTACDYCPYPAFCRFDRGRLEGSCRRLVKIDKDGFFTAIQERLLDQEG